MQRRWISGIVLLFVSLAVTLGSTEFVLRHFLPVRGMIYELHDRYLYRLIPGSRKLVSLAGHSLPSVLVHINAAGRRGDESAWPQAKYRVVVYGDSYIAAEYSTEPDTYVAQLRQVLNASVPSTIVLNAGVTGYGPDQESLRMEDESPALKPDLVIVALCAGNDFGDLLRNKLFRLDAAGLMTPNVPAIDDALKREFRVPLEMSSIQIVRAFQSAFLQKPKGPPNATPPSTALDPTAIRLGHRIAEYDSYVVGGDNVVHNLLADEYDADVSLQPDSPSARYRLSLMAQVVSRIRQITEKNGAKLLLLIIPERCDVLDNCEASRARHRFPGYRTSGLTDAVESIARDQKLTTLNLFEPFRTGHPDGLYLPLDEHWNPSGQKLAARLTVDVILHAGLLR